MPGARRLLAIGAAALAAGIVGCPPPPPPPDNSPEVRLQAIATNLVSPVDLAHANDNSGRMFIVDQVGVIRVIDAGGVLLTLPFLDVSDRLVGLNAIFDERGLLGLAFHPQYAANGRFFVYYNPSAGGRVRVSEFRVSGDDPNIADSASERVLLEITKPQDNHNGGQLAFGPDGFLYIAVGDGGGANDQGPGHTPNLGNGQDRSTLLGKLLRLNVDNTGGAAYTVPADNPFVSTAGARGEIYAYGLRNPYRFSFDNFEGASRLFVGDVGQGEFEEVNIVNRGDNLGWYIREGAHCFDPDDIADAACVTGVDGSRLVDPILEYPHPRPGSNAPVTGLSVIGGFVYRGAQVSDLFGRYVFADYSNSFVPPQGKLLVAGEENGRWTLEELRVADRASGRIERYILSLGRDQDNELYVLTSLNSGPSGQTGAIYRVLATD